MSGNFIAIIISLLLSYEARSLSEYSGDANNDEIFLSKHSTLDSSLAPSLGLLKTNTLPKTCIEVARSSVKFGVTHTRTKFQCRGVAIYGATQLEHHRDTKLLHLSTIAPSNWELLPLEPGSLWPKQMPEELSDLSDTMFPIWFPTAEGLVAAWRYTERGADVPHQVVLRESDFSELLRAPLSFHANENGVASIFKVSRLNSETNPTSLTGLSGDGFLNGKIFSIFTSDGDRGRVFDEDQNFAVSPDQEFEFQQVQAYGNLTRAADWFRDELGFKWDDHHINVRVDMLIDGTDPDNAAYYPSIDTGADPEIHFGRGNELQDLAIDSDVAIHELSHHIIFQYIDDRFGDAAILHEGFADYFAYAVNGDPNLAESVLPNNPYLRTANVDEQYRFDNPYLSAAAHKKGQIWAAFLWQLRIKLGPIADQLIMQAMNYLDGHSSIDQALAAILQSREDMKLAGALEDSAVEIEDSRCVIVAEAVSRGMAHMIAKDEGDQCDINLKELSRENEKRLNKEDDVDGEKLPELFGVSCGSIASNGSSNHSGGWIILLSLLFGYGLIKRRANIECQRG